MAKRYEQYSPFELAQLRSSGKVGEAQYQELRGEWVAAGKPRGEAGTSIFAAQRYEQLTPGQRAQLRSSGPSGEERYEELRSDWERRGEPGASQPAGGDAA